MNAQGQLSPQDWMLWPETAQIFAALEKDGKEARYVGGCVRDGILKRPVKDIDIATPEAPERVMELLQQAGIKAIPTGLAHGTVTAIIGDKHFEITTLRIDVKPLGRKAEVAFTQDWKQDAARRDFTINAMTADKEGKVYDYFSGLADLGNFYVRFVGDPKERIKEDILRILRFFRFVAHYGGNAIDIPALAACRTFAPELSKLSGERVRSELFKLLEAHDPSSILLIMQGEKILPHILPEAKYFGELRMLCWLENRGLPQGSLKLDSLRRLACLVEFSEDIKDRLKLSNIQAQKLKAMLLSSFNPQEEVDQSFYKIGELALPDIILIHWAKARAQGPRETNNHVWQEIFFKAQNWQKPKLPVTAQDLLDRGLSSGPELGVKLKQIENIWLESGFKLTKDELLNYKKTLS